MGSKRLTYCRHCFTMYPPILGKMCHCYHAYDPRQRDRHYQNIINRFYDLIRDDIKKGAREHQLELLKQAELDCREINGGQVYEVRLGDH